MGRTKQPKKKPVSFSIPTYTMGSVIDKGPDTHRILITNDWAPGNKDKSFTLLNLVTGQEQRGVAPKTLAIYGYKIKEQLGYEEAREMAANKDISLKRRGFTQSKKRKLQQTESKRTKWPSKR